MKKITFLFLVSFFGCASTNRAADVAVGAAQKFVPEYGFHFKSGGAADLQVYPHALYYAGTADVSVALERRGAELYAFSLSPGHERFMLIRVDTAGDRVRLVETTCEQAHAMGHLTWVPCTPSADASNPAGVLFEYEISTGTVKKPGRCPVDDNGNECCPDVIIGAVCPG